MTVAEKGVRMSEPLVSILIRCYNATDTLPRALASVLAQDYGRWECIVVDDGSDDDPTGVVDRVGDPRIRLIRLERNRGRSVASQVAIDEAGGELFSMLDADDWIYPWKLSRQVEALAKDPDLVLVSCGLAIVDKDNELVGCRTYGEGVEALEVRRHEGGVEPPRIPCTPSIIRTAPARVTGYDRRLKRAQDSDFMHRLLTGRRYGVLVDPLYVYAEYSSFGRATIEDSYRYHRIINRKYLSSHPIASRAAMIRDQVKLWIYRTAFAVGREEYLVSRRSSEPTADQREVFDRARSEIEEKLRSLV